MKKILKKKIFALRRIVLVVALIFLEVVLVALLITFSPPGVDAGIGQNVTVLTRLQVGNVYPEIINITFLNATNGLDLVPNATRNVTIEVVVRDYNGDSDIKNVTAEFYDLATSSYGSADSNNKHYNTTCTLDIAYGDEYLLRAICNFSVWYYAFNSTWNATATAVDTYGLAASGNGSVKVNTLLAVGLPSEIDYGIVNATNVSEQKIANVTNFGNVRINLTLSGYAVIAGDNLSMNCSAGNVQNISIGYEKYNLTESNTSVINLSYFENNNFYLNLTSSPTVKKFGLDLRRNDTFNEAINATYWRIYVPRGVAGNCTGNIVFGANMGIGS